jgi:hypothetical protein
LGTFLPCRSTKAASPGHLSTIRFIYDFSLYSISKNQLKIKRHFIGVSTKLIGHFAIFTLRFWQIRT